MTELEKVLQYVRGQRMRAESAYGLNFNKDAADRARDAERILVKLIEDAVK